MPTFDPHPTLRECIELHEGHERTRPPGTPIHVHRAVVVSTEDLSLTAYGRRHRAAGPDEGRCEACRAVALALMGVRSGIAVGPIVETIEVASGQPRRCLDCDDVHLCADRMRDCVCPACGGENIETEWAELRVAGGRP
jgi:predicted RNA-binding Zn-ribbon protein involved in translation (DUF1610 family)